MARKPNYDFEKRRKEMDRKAKKDAKREAKRERKRSQGGDSDTVAEEGTNTERQEQGS